MREVQRMVSEVSRYKNIIRKFALSIKSLIMMVSLKNYNKYDIWIKSFIIKVGWSNDSFAIALTYINWETDAIVGVELLQNVGIAIVCIFVTTLITLGMSASLSQLESTSFS